MPSTVDVDMLSCDRKARVTVTMREDGDLDVSIESDCEVVRGYAERLKRITPMDVYGFEHSVINKDEVRGQLTPTCLVPNAVYSAAFLEMGMMTESLARKKGRNSIEYVFPQNRRFSGRKPAQEELLRHPVLLLPRGLALGHRAAVPGLVHVVGKVGYLDLRGDRILAYPLDVRHVRDLRVVRQQPQRP